MCHTLFSASVCDQSPGMRAAAKLRPFHTGRGMRVKLRWPPRSACAYLFFFLSFFAAALRVPDAPAPCHFETFTSLTLYPLREFVFYVLCSSV